MRPFVFQLIGSCAALVMCASQSEATQVKARACGPSAIRAAAARHVAPRLVGCRYDEVAVPLVRYFSIFPALTKTPGSQATSTILAQSPAAGEPLAAGGQLALSVSVGRSPRPEEAIGATIPGEAPPTGVAGAIETQPTSPDLASVSSTSGAPIEIMEFTVASEAPAALVPSPSVRLPPLAYLFRPGLLWAWLGIAVAGTVFALVFRGRRRRSEFGYDRVPKVTARLEYMPSRLNAYGPLIVGRGALNDPDN